MYSMCFSSTLSSMCLSSLSLGISSSSIVASAESGLLKGRKSDSTCFVFFFFQAEDGIRDRDVTGVQTCALPISNPFSSSRRFTAELWEWERQESQVLVRWHVKNLERPSIEVSTIYQSALMSWLTRSEERRVGKECRSRWVP